jgi:hypothetical protein
MSQVLYASRKFCDEEIVNISQEVGVVTRHMTKLGQVHGNGFFTQRSTSITYNGCSDLF